MTSGPERGQVGDHHVISLGLHITFLYARIFQEMVARRPQDLDVMTVENGDRRSHTGTTSTSDVKQNDLFDSAD